MKLRAFAPAVVLLCSTVGIALTTSAAIAADTIIPGQGIGSATVGGSLFDVTKVLGNPKTTGLMSTPGTTRYRWYDVIFTGPRTTEGSGGLFVDARADGTIVKVGVFYGGPGYSLDNGLHTRSRQSDDGAHEADVRRLMGEPEKVIVSGSLRGLVYRGVVFWANQSGQVTQIDVIAP